MIGDRQGEKKKRERDREGGGHNASQDQVERCLLHNNDRR